MFFPTFDARRKFPTEIRNFQLFSNSVSNDAFTPDECNKNKKFNPLLVGTMNTHREKLFALLKAGTQLLSEDGSGIGTGVHVYRLKENS